MASVTREQQIILKAAHVRSEHETQAPAIHIPLAASKGGLGLLKKSRSAVVYSPGREKPTLQNDHFKPIDKLFVLRNFDKFLTRYSVQYSCTA
jgi:hypothetical protein